MWANLKTRLCNFNKVWGVGVGKLCSLVSEAVPSVHLMMASDSYKSYTSWDFTSSISCDKGAVCDIRFFPMKHKQIHPTLHTTLQEGTTSPKSSLPTVCCPPLWHHVGFTQGPKVNSHTEMTQTLQNHYRIRNHRQRAGSSLLHSVIIFLFTGKKKKHAG